MNGQAYTQHLAHKLVHRVTTCFHMIKCIRLQEGVERGIVVLRVSAPSWPWASHSISKPVFSPMGRVWGRCVVTSGVLSSSKHQRLSQAAFLG